MKPLAFILALLMVALMVASVYAAPTAQSGGFLEGYCSAVLERELGVADALVQADDGVVTVVLPEGSAIDPQRVREVLGTVRGVREVVVRTGREPAVQVETPREAPASGGARSETVARTAPGAEIGLFLRPSVFEPLLADPRWPHSSVGYVYHIDDDLDGVGQVSLGESFSFYRDSTDDGLEWEFGPQASIFSVFTLDTSSPDLLNTDFYVSLAGSMRKEDFSLLTRVFHQSSHLGDEFLINTGATRLARSYEGVDLILSYDVGEAMRVYGGAGYIFRIVPAEIGKWNLQYGMELRSPETYVNHMLRPIAGIDVKHQEQGDWDCDISLRGGVQIEHPKLTRQQLQLLLEYYNGTNPNGQFFFDDRIEYYGIGLHVYF